MDFIYKDDYSIEDLLQIIKMLRSPEGCPWDRAQTHHSIRRNFIEETYEAVEAIDTEDSLLLKEELGDVLLQVLLHSEIEDEAGRFSFAEVCNGLAQKLVFRHPHVFGESTATTAEEALDEWDKRKKIEKSQTTATQTLEQVSKALPALMYSEKVQKRAAKSGFDYTNITQVLEHLKSEIVELEEAMVEEDQSHIQEELGDVLFSTVNLSRFLSVDPEKALDDSTAKFINRFTKVEQLANQRGIDLGEADLNQLNRLWEEAKDIH